MFASALRLRGTLARGSRRSFVKSYSACLFSSTRARRPGSLSSPMVSLTADATCRRWQHSTKNSNSSSTSNRDSCGGGTADDAHSEVETVPALDVYARTRVSNYHARVAPGEPLDLALTAPAAASPPEWRAECTVRAEVLEGGRPVLRQIRARGYGADKAAAAGACFMHADRCLHALRVAVFGSEERQNRWAAAQRAKGLDAPSWGDPPAEFSDVSLPRPVRVGQRTSAAAATAAFRAAQRPIASAPASAPSGRAGGGASAASVPGGAASPRGGRGSSPSAAGAPWRASARRVQRFDHDPFLLKALTDMSQLQQAVMQHNFGRLEEAEGHNGGAAGGGSGGASKGDDADDDSIVIEAHEIEVLQPGSSRPAHGSSDGGAASRPRSMAAAAAPAPPARSAVVTMARQTPLRELVCDFMIDESEGGAYSMVEGDSEEWVMSPDGPSCACLRDPLAPQRVSEYVARFSGDGGGGKGASHAFEAAVRTAVSVAPSQVWDEERFLWRTEPDTTWYTTSLDIPGFRRLVAVGKATSLRASLDLCAMHAEHILQHLGVHVFADPARQTAYYDACLRWGLRFAPEPLDVSALTPSEAAAFPKPLKELYRGRSSKVPRHRGSPMSTPEKLLALNRRVVSEQRQHLIEVNAFEGGGAYEELLRLAPACVRSFMVAQAHPYEAALFNFVYSPGSQYRCSVYLPLTAAFGVRGGCAIASSPERAARLCSMHAVDVLCALDRVPAACRQQQPHWQRVLQLREELGMLAAPAGAEGLYLVRSPPGYRESTRYASCVIAPPAELWRVMLTDAAVFDVARPQSEMDAAPLRGGFLSTARALFAVCARHWGLRDAWDGVRHYCGTQTFRGAARAPANNYWMALPLPEHRYGRRVALGRCVTRSGAEAHFYYHVFRILAALDAAPWDALSEAELTHTLYSGAGTQTAERGDALQEDLRLWRVMRDLVTEKPVGGAATAAASTHVREAEIIGGGAAARQTRDYRSVPSPNPVMSTKLARMTLTQ